MRNYLTVEPYDGMTEMPFKVFEGLVQGGRKD